MVSTHDVGRAINPQLVVGQIEGAVVQAHGYALSEDLQVVDGRITNPRLSTYLIPGIGDMPTESRAWCSSWPTHAARGVRRAWPRCR